MKKLQLSSVVAAVAGVIALSQAALAYDYIPRSAANTYRPVANAKVAEALGRVPATISKTARVPATVPAPARVAAPAPDPNAWIYEGAGKDVQRIVPKAPKTSYSALRVRDYIPKSAPEFDGNSSLINPGVEPQPDPRFAYGVRGRRVYAQPAQECQQCAQSYGQQNEPTLYGPVPASQIPEGARGIPVSAVRAGVRPGLEGGQPTLYGPVPASQIPEGAKGIPVSAVHSGRAYNGDCGCEGANVYPSYNAAPKYGAAPAQVGPNGERLYGPFPLSEIPEGVNVIRAR